MTSNIVVSDMFADENIYDRTLGPSNSNEDPVVGIT